MPRLSICPTSLRDPNRREQRRLHEGQAPLRKVRHLRRRREPQVLSACRTTVAVGLHMRSHYSSMGTRSTTSTTEFPPELKRMRTKIRQDCCRTRRLHSTKNCFGTRQPARTCMLSFSRKHRRRAKDCPEQPPAIWAVTHRFQPLAGLRTAQHQQKSLVEMKQTQNPTLMELGTKSCCTRVMFTSVFLEARMVKNGWRRKCSSSGPDPTTGRPSIDCNGG